MSEKKIVFNNCACVAFDLDGTLTDPAEGLLNGFEYAFRKLNVKYGSRSSLVRFIGPPLFDCWRAEFGFSAEEADRAIELFREYYTVYGWRENRMYDGISELLSRLRASGRILVVATSKPEDQARRIIRLFGLDKYLDFVGGAVCHHHRATKAEVLRYALDSVGVSDADNCVLVGDRRFDAEGARLVGAHSLGVLWGHGERSELDAAGFERVVASIAELGDALGLHPAGNKKQI